MPRRLPLAGLFVVSDGLPRDLDPRLDAVTRACTALAASGGLVGGIGTGAAWVAPSGLLRGHRWTLHWAHVAQTAERHADSIVSSNLYEIDRSRLSCAGGTASLDLMIAWLGLQHGERFAQQLVAHFGLERLRARDEGQRVPSAARLGGSAKLVEAVALMEANIGEPLTTRTSRGWSACRGGSSSGSFARTSTRCRRAGTWSCGSRGLAA